MILIFIAFYFITCVIKPVIFFVIVFYYFQYVKELISSFGMWRISESNR